MTVTLKMMETNNKCQVGIVRGKEWRQHCDMLPGTLEKRVSNINIRFLIEP